MAPPCYSFTFKSDVSPRKSVQFQTCTIQLCTSATGTPLMHVEDCHSKDEWACVLPANLKVMGGQEGRYTFAIRYSSVGGQCTVCPADTSTRDPFKQDLNRMALSGYSTGHLNLYTGKKKPIVPPISALTRIEKIMQIKPIQSSTRTPYATPATTDSVVPVSHPPTMSLSAGPPGRPQAKAVPIASPLSVPRRKETRDDHARSSLIDKIRGKERERTVLPFGDQGSPPSHIHTSPTSKKRPAPSPAVRIPVRNPNSSSSRADPPQINTFASAATFFSPSPGVAPAAERARLQSRSSTGGSGLIPRKEMGRGGSGGLGYRSFMDEENAPTSRESSLMAGFRSFRSSAGGDVEGFRNLGETCYIASVVQMLFHSNFKDAILSHPSTSSTAFEAFATLFDLKSTGKPVSLQALKTALAFRPDAKPSSTRLAHASNEQEDAHEFLTAVLDGCLLPQLPHPLDPCSFGVTTTLHCTHCEYKSVRVEPFNDLSLPFPAVLDEEQDDDETRPKLGVVKMVRDFLGEERVEFNCESAECKQRRQDEPDATVGAAVMERRLVTPPRTLFVHLKRFEIVQRLDTEVSKENVAVVGAKVPQMLFKSAKRLDLVQMDAHFSVTGTDLDLPTTFTKCHYTLKGVILHHGATPKSGHYTFLGREVEPESREIQWTRYDDGTVTRKLAEWQVEVEIERSGYIYCFERRNKVGRSKM